MSMYEDEEWRELTNNECIYQGDLFTVSNLQMFENHYLNFVNQMLVLALICH